jgi:hypothetical protein
MPYALATAITDSWLNLEIALKAHAPKVQLVERCNCDGEKQHLKVVGAKLVARLGRNETRTKCFV